MIVEAGAGAAASGGADRARTVLCIRHGQSTFNAAFPESLVDPLHFDARLTEVGHQQVERAREELRDIAIDLVVTSPLTRALQTTAGLFAGHPSAPAMLVEALHRERVENSCDVGRSPAMLREEFPAFTLDHLPDVWWHAEGEPDARGICVEPVETVQARAAEFRAWLRRRPERSIAVVGHGTFLYYLTGTALMNCEIVRFALDAEAPELAAAAPI